MNTKRYAYPMLILSLLHAAGASAESLSAMMERMRSQQAVRIAYDETRTMEMLDQPWRGSGYMYSLPPDTMLKEQVQPERLLMAISGDAMYYFDPGNDIRHEGSLDADDPMTLNVAVFKALMTGDQALLEKFYRAGFESGSEGWVLRLTDKNAPDSAFAIEISGLPGQPPRRIVVEQADGERSEFALRQENPGEEAAAAAQRLQQELLETD